MGEKKAIRVAYGEALAALGAENDKVVALDADLAHATMSATFADKFPERFFNAGIAEANMIAHGGRSVHHGLYPLCQHLCGVLRPLL